MWMRFCEHYKEAEFVSILKNLSGVATQTALSPAPAGKTETTNSEKRSHGHGIAESLNHQTFVPDQ